MGTPRPADEIIMEYRGIINIVIAERIKLQDRLELLTDPATEEHF